MCLLWLVKKVELVSTNLNNFDCVICVPSLNWIIFTFQVQSVLSCLASSTNIHIIASIDHINAPLSEFFSPSPTQGVFNPSTARIFTAFGRLRIQDYKKLEFLNISYLAVKELNKNMKSV